MPLPPLLSDTRSLLRDFSRALPLQLLSTEFLGEKYVNRTTDKIRDPVLNLRAAIRNESEEDNGCYLFSGLRGSGKTTELKRLIAELRGEDGIHAYYCDASDYLDLNDP
jgi:predicted AAA+ superfamily ATPase